MVTLTEGKHEGEFIGELAMGIGYHVDPVVVLSGQNLVAGTVVGKQTSGGKFVAYDNAGTDDGRRTPAGILVAAVNASAGDAAGKVLVRGPAIIEHPATTLVVHPGDTVFIDEWTLLHYRHG